MASSYLQEQSAEPYFERTWNLVVALFDGADEMETFVREHLGVETATSVNWSQSGQDAAFDLMSEVVRTWRFADLISALSTAYPDNPDLNQLVTDLVDGGIITPVG